MKKSLSQVQAQIERLQKEAEAIRAKELHRVIARIKESIAQYGLTASDLGLNRSSAARQGAAGKAAAKKPTSRGSRKNTGVMKFRGPEGQTWTGHGRAPNWYKQAIADGATRESLLIK